MPDQERQIDEDVAAEAVEDEQQAPDRRDAPHDDSEQLEGVANQPEEDPESRISSKDPHTGETSDASDAASDAELDVSPDMPEDEAERQMLAELEKIADSDDLDSDPGDHPGNVSGDLGDDVEVRQAEFQQLSSSLGEDSPKNLDLLLDVTLPISIELGRTTMNVQDILNLGPGSVVELNKLAGEPVDLLVNNKVVAKGEVVVIDENFGLRVTSLISPEERLKSLGE
jgi:flagellar motor switch protein FliN/FliY